jgi:hypothetical protein
VDDANSLLENSKELLELLIDLVFIGQLGGEIIHHIKVNIVEYEIYWNQE